MALKDTLSEIIKNLQTLDTDLAEELDRREAQREEELIRVKAKKDKEIARLASDLHDEREANVDAKDLLEEVEALRKGVLDTSYLDKRRLFETLAESWEDLTARQIGQIENILTGVTA
jgi:hypothetical protein